MIYITGDVHAPYDITKLKMFKTSGLTKNDYLIVAGDFGVIWNFRGEDDEERQLLNWFEDQPYTTLFVDGNHECHPRLNVFPVEEWNGGKIHRIRPSIIHLMRGQVYTINGKKIFTMGGASSHDKEIRTDRETWWEEELPSNEEYEEAFKNLEKNNYEVDYVITHCMPDNIQYRLASWYEHDKLTNFLFTVDKDLKFKHWYSGYYHIDKDVDDLHTVLYDEILPLGECVGE